MLFKNHFKTTIRRLIADKIYLLVNVLSLSAGLLCCLFIFKYVHHQWSYDRFHNGANQIFRLELEVFSEDNNSSRYSYLGISPVNWLKDIPEIQKQTRFATFNWDMNVTVQDNSFTENGIISADSSFFNLFSFRLIEGQPGSVLKNPNSVVLTKSIAMKYFGTEKVVGKIIKVSSQSSESYLTITGIVEDTPSNSHFSFDLITSADVYKALNGISIQNYSNTYCYIRTMPGALVGELEKKINSLYSQKESEAASVSQFYAKPMISIFLHSSAIGELSTNGNAVYVNLFLLVAFIILGISCINFTTLATARSLKRKQEIGVRKVFGAKKKSLVSIGLLEGVMLSVLALSLSYVLGLLLLPFFNELTGEKFILSDFTTPYYIILMFGIALFAGIFSALYPSFMLAQDNLTSLLKDNFSKEQRGSRLWKTMVVAQFAISMILIGATYIIQKQINFIYSKDLGFKKEYIITLPNYFGRQLPTFFEQLNRHPDIQNTTVSSYIPGVSKNIGRTTIETESESESMTFEAVVVDSYFFETFKIPIISGRGFSKKRASDSTQAFIINETAAQTLGWENPIGKKLNAYGRDGYVIGIAKDFNFSSLHNDISPMVFLIYDQFYAQIAVRINPNNSLSESVSYIKEKWEDLLPETPFRYNFLDDQFESLYKSEQETKALFFSFSIVSILIAFLGLISFTSYTLLQKKHEIGIRKVLGASVYDILKLFYSGYGKLLFISTIIALPVIYLFLKNWLRNFSFTTKIGLEAFAVPLSIAIVILFITVSFQTLRSASQNPIDAIKNE